MSQKPLSPDEMDEMFKRALVRPENDWPSMSDFCNEGAGVLAFFAIALIFLFGFLGMPG